MSETLPRLRGAGRLVIRFGGACAVVYGFQLMLSAQADGDILAAADASPNEVCATGYYPWDGNPHHDCRDKDLSVYEPYRTDRTLDLLGAVSFGSSGTIAMVATRRRD